ncbi:MAG: N-acetyltransferase family protein [Planctomycetota bacterium]
MPTSFDKLIVRDATLADLPAIVEIHNASIPGRQASAYLEPVTVEGRREWFDAHSPDRRPLWVVIDPDSDSGGEGNQTIGWTCLSDYSPRPTYDITAEVSMYLTPAWQGRGLGTWLMQKLVGYAGTIGVEAVISLVFAHNPASLRIHQKLGFDQWGLLPAVTNMAGVRRDVVVLGIKTSAAPSV